jgi:hypothetical protein
MRAARCAVGGALIGAATCLALPGAVRAQTAETPAADPEAEYATLVSGALSEFEQGRWEQARVWFERAHAVRPNARTLWGLGVTAFELGRYVQAIEELETALGDQRYPLEDAQREKARDVIARAERHVAMLSIELVPERAALTLDGAETPDRQLVLSPGRYTLIARAPGYRDRELSVDAEPGDKRVVRLTLPPIALQVAEPPPVRASPAATRQAPQPARDDGDEGSVLESWWFWTAAAVVVAGGVTTAVLVANDSDDDARPKIDVEVMVLTRQR